MAALTPVVNLFDVQGMVEIYGLMFLGIKEFGKNTPSQDYTCCEADDEKEDDWCGGTLGLLFGNRMCLIFLFAHEYSVKLWFVYIGTATAIDDSLPSAVGLESCQLLRLAVSDAWYNR
jgi:hypothetical protein